ncbi:MAG: type II secretion system minor pseudopilin GspK [Moraxellaceae bacterium]
MPARLLQLPPLKRMRGVALLTVLLVVALATILAVGMIRAQHLALQYAGGLFNQDQAWLYTQGAEDFVRDLLSEDFKDDKRRGAQTDHPGEFWAKPFPPFPVDGGMINARVNDVQGRFNLNRLWHDSAPDTAASDIFTRLLKNLDLPESLAPALIDWMDNDNDPTGSDGAEDDFYSRLERPYRAANLPLNDISELRLVRGFTPEIIARLRPYVCALPASALLNINTADAVVLAALSPTLSSRTATELSSQRPTKGWGNIDDFLRQPVFNGLEGTQKTALMTQISVNTHYFQLLADAVIAGRHSVLLAVLVRNDSGTLQVVARDFSQKVMPATVSAENKDTTDPVMESMTEAARNIL